MVLHSYLSTQIFSNDGIDVSQGHLRRSMMKDFQGSDVFVRQKVVQCANMLTNLF